MMPNHRWPGVLQHRPGLTEMIASRALSKFMGMPKSTKTIRLKGLREVVGKGILTSGRAAPAIASKASRGDRKPIICRCDASQAFAKFRNTEDGCIKVALKPF